MPVINFRPEFAELVASGKKRQTIRAIRKRPFKVGDKLYLYTGLRTKQARNITHIANVMLNYDCTPIGKSVRHYVTCKEVHEIEIVEFYDYDVFDIDYRIILDKITLTCTQADSIALQDGFETAEIMCDWFKKVHGLPFKGQLARWLMKLNIDMETFHEN